MKNRSLYTKFFNAAGVLILILPVFILVTASYKRHRGAAADEDTARGKIKQYVCSMHPQVIRDSPGDCPICGMFLIEKIDEDKNRFDTSLTDIILPVNESVLGSSMTISPEQEAMPLVIESTGVINFDPGKLHTTSARFGGIIERSFVKFQFQHINKGQKIYEIYCPDIYTDQWNYVKLIQSYPDRDDITAEAREWFRMIGLSEGQVDSLKRAPRPDYHLAVYSDAEGYVVSRDFDPENFFFTRSASEVTAEAPPEYAGIIGLNDGVAVEKGDMLFKLIDVRSLRADLKIKTEFAPLLKRGQKVIISDTANPGKHFDAEVSQIEPLNGALFQIIKVYITDNERILLPGRQISAQIIAGDHAGLWVPASAVVDLGSRKSVFRMIGNKFVATEVRTGVRSGNKIEILSGIDVNSVIAEKALLLTDSDGIIDIN